ncbi:VOC family protein [Pararhizobium qamdonense]|uniref:VOC family protein n=1 Tax=Pararhizobium qamdonense TaxID=3031126 RepID=UPI0023E1AEFB|nr:VOC family protein [Pararhizobium qamdonense]
MRFVNPIPFVRDISISKAFYGEKLGLAIKQDFGDFVLFETGFAIHEGKSLETTVWGHPSVSSGAYGRQNVLLYFEHDPLDALFARIAGHVILIHPIETQPWGQRVFRFYDPDGHAIEIGEPLDQLSSE